MKKLSRLLLPLLFAQAAQGWVQSVEFAWNSWPTQLWERELARLKDSGISHVSLPPGADSARLDEAIRLLKRLDLEADLERPVPEEMSALTRGHGGPLTEPAAAPVRISALAADALPRSRKLLASGKTIIWTDMTDTLGPDGFHTGAVSFGGREGPAAAVVRRSAQLIRYWGATLPSMKETSSGTQFATEAGVSFLAASNDTATEISGERRAFYAPARRAIALPGVSVPAHDVLWLPVDVPLMAGPLCKDCSAFSTQDHLVYATAELTSMEYENGILAMEFSAPAPGEVILQLSREPSGPFVAGGKPMPFDWDDHALRARLTIPKGSGPGNHVRIGLAIEPPDATAFFQSARVLLIGETNQLTAEYSSPEIARRSRLRSVPEMDAAREPTPEPLRMTYRIKVPQTVVPGDHAELSIEADGSQMSHARPQFLSPVAVRFSDAISVRLGPGSALPLFPATIPVNQRSGREVTLAVRNNAPEIRTFEVAVQANGLQFSPEKLKVVVGASATREVTFRVFTTGAAPGLHSGEARLSGAASVDEPFRLLVIPPGGAASLAENGFALLESEKFRASFYEGRWLEFVTKDNGQNQIAPGGITFQSGAAQPAGDALLFPSGKRFRMEDLEPLLPRPKK